MVKIFVASLIPKRSQKGEAIKRWAASLWFLQILFYWWPRRPDENGPKKTKQIADHHRNYFN